MLCYVWLQFQQREGQDIMLAVDAQAKVFCR